MSDIDLIFENASKMDKTDYEYDVLSSDFAITAENSDNKLVKAKMMSRNTLYKDCLVAGFSTLQKDTKGLILFVGKEKYPVFLPFNPGINNAVDVGTVRIETPTSTGPKKRGNEPVRGMSKITKITVHISAGSFNETVETITKDHIEERGFRTIGYHYVVYGDGTLHTGRADTEVGAHVFNDNQGNIGISYCSRGNDFDDKAPYGKYTTKQQFEALPKFVAQLMKKYNVSIGDVYGHNDFPGAGKACPCFKVRVDPIFQGLLRKYLA